MARHTAVLAPVSVNLIFWPTLIKHFHWKNNNTKTHQICSHSCHWRATVADHILQAGLPPFCRVGFQPRSPGQRRETVSGWCISLMETVWLCSQRRGVAQRCRHARISWLASAASFMLHNRAPAPQPQPADKSRACNHADGRRGTWKVDCFPTDGVCELLPRLQAWPRPAPLPEFTLSVMCLAGN